MKFLCDQCKAKYQIADDKIAGKTVRMKCRKCGHQIEVRAAVTETSVASKLPAEETKSPSPSGAPRPGIAHSRATAPKLATSLAAARPSPPRTSGAPLAPKGPADAKPGALAGAFSKSIQHDEAQSPYDLELSPADEWYVAIAGVPVGPIRVAELRSRAASGAVTDESLVWQEGLEEWRALKSYPELSAAVREAASTGGSSHSIPPIEVKAGLPPSTLSGRPTPSRAPLAPQRLSGSPGSPGGLPMRHAPAHAAAARSNVVPFTSRLATAERLAEPETALLAPDPFGEDAPTEIGTLPSPLTAPLAAPTVPTGDPFAAKDPFAKESVAKDPFALPRMKDRESGISSPGAAAPAVLAPIASPVVTARTSQSEAAPKKSPPWIAIAMIVLAAAFGITAAIAIFMQAKTPTQKETVYVQVPGAPAQPAEGTNRIEKTGPAPDIAPSASASAGKLPMATGPVGNGGKIAAVAPTTTASTATTSGGLDLGGLGGSRPTVESGSNGGNKAPAGQCYSEGQLRSAIGQHEYNIRRMCWLQANSQKPTVRVSVSVTIGEGGNVESASASGDDPVVSRCVENDVRRWSFPAMGCRQQTGFSYNFVRQ